MEGQVSKYVDAPGIQKLRLTVDKTWRPSEIELMK